MGPGIEYSAVSQTQLLYSFIINGMNEYDDCPKDGHKTTIHSLHIRRTHILDTSYTDHTYHTAGADLGGARGPRPFLSSGNHSEKGKILLFANCKIQHFAFSECRKCHFRDSRCSQFGWGGHAPGPR